MGISGMSEATEVPVPRHRFSRAEYERMVGAGVFEPETRLELLEGEIVEMAPQKSRHATGVRLVEEALRRAFGEGFDVRTQLPLAIDDASEPEPDVAVVRGAPRDYRDAHPTTALLVVEVADTTLGYDRVRKLRAYARAGIPEYWVLDVEGEALEVYRAPSAEGYGARNILKTGESVTPLAAPDPPVAVADLLP